MPINVDPRYEEQIEDLLKEQDLWDLDDLMLLDRLDDFDEVPLYSRFDQLSFLDGVSMADGNRILIRAAVRHLGQVIEHSRSYFESRDRDFFCMVSITDWDSSDGTSDWLQPALWLARPSNPVMAPMRIYEPRSAHSRFVAEAIDGEPDYLINEGLARFPGPMHIWSLEKEIKKFENEIKKLSGGC